MLIALVKKLSLIVHAKLSAFRLEYVKGMSVGVQGLDCLKLFNHFSKTSTKIHK